MREEKGEGGEETYDTPFVVGELFWEEERDGEDVDVVELIR